MANFRILNLGARLRSEGRQGAREPARRRRVRDGLVLVHRWLGLFTALFLFVAGLTGAVIAWDHELDAWLNPRFFRAAQERAPARSSLSLATQLEADDPRLVVRYLPLFVEPGHTLVAQVAPRIDHASGRPFALGFDQVALDPATGAIRGRRTWGEPAFRRENLLPFLYRLHFSLHLPRVAGNELGMLLMGLVAMVWVLDTLVALSISFPSRKSWRKSFAFRVRAGGYRLLFDLHRSGGVWVWPLLSVLAVSAVSMNLGSEVMRPIVSLFSTLTPNPFEGEPDPNGAPGEPGIDRSRAIEIAQAQARRRGIREPPGSLLYAGERGMYAVGFFRPGREHGDGGLGNPWLYVDAGDGHLRGATIPGEGSGGDVFMQAQFPLHSGRIAGLPGRIAISLLGMGVALLSVTGIVIWAKKRRARVRKPREDLSATGAS